MEVKITGSPYVLYDILKNWLAVIPVLPAATNRMPALSRMLFFLVYKRPTPTHKPPNIRRTVLRIGKRLDARTMPVEGKTETMKLFVILITFKSDLAA